MLAMLPRPVTFLLVLAQKPVNGAANSETGGDFTDPRLVRRKVPEVIQRFADARAQAISPGRLKHPHADPIVV
jgi:hypothetical protein